MRKLVAILTAVTSLAACSGSSTSDSNSIPLDQIPAELAKSFCAAEQACSPFFYAVAFSNTDCVSQFTKQFQEASYNDIQNDVTAGTINIGEQPRVITPEDKEQLKSHLQGFHSKVSIGVDVGARDGMQLASQLQSVLKEAQVSVEDIEYVAGSGKILYGMQLEFHGEEKPMGAAIHYWSDSQLGILAGALNSAHMPVASVHPSPSCPEDTIKVIIGFDPKTKPTD